MSNSEQIIEVADFSRDRLDIAAKSLERFVSFERDRLNAEKRLAQAEIQKPDIDSKHRAELRQVLNENSLAWARLELGHKNSTVRRAVVRGSTATRTPGAKAEERLGQSTGAVGPMTGANSRAAGKKPVRLCGYAAVFNCDSVLLYGCFIETIKQGAFANALKKPDMNCTFNFQHDDNFIMGRASRKCNTLQLKEDRIGLAMSADLIDSDHLCDFIAKRTEKGIIVSMSFAFLVEKDEWILETGKPDRRIIIEVKDLYDVAAVVWPAYKDASIWPVYKRCQSSDRSDFDFDDDFVGFGVAEPTSPIGQREIARKHRKAGRILNRLRPEIAEAKEKEKLEAKQQAIDKKQADDDARYRSRQYDLAGRIIDKIKIDKLCQLPAGIGN